MLPMTEQAIMLQLDHMFIIGAYLPPRNSQATHTLTVLDEWIASAGALEPVVILGDFNQEPELADRWTALADGGAAKVASLPDGTRAPTRWEGNRCIDWIWSSHPFMVDELAFSEAVFSDHKALTFNLQYSQECVQSFKQVPTRSLLRPEQIPQKDWDKAMVQAWQQVPMPPPLNLHTMLPAKFAAEASAMGTPPMSGQKAALCKSKNLSRPYFV